MSPAASSSSACRGVRGDVAVLVVLVQGLPVIGKNAFYCPRRIIGAEVPMKPPTRRTFLKHAAAGVAGGAIAASGRAGAQSAASQDRVAGANGRIRVALIGCGGQGTSDLRNALRLGAQCV